MDVGTLETRAYSIAASLSIAHSLFLHSLKALRIGHGLPPQQRVEQKLELGYLYQHEKISEERSECLILASGPL